VSEQQATVLAALREVARTIPAPRTETAAERRAAQKLAAENLRKLGGMTLFVRSSPATQMTAASRYLRSPAAEFVRYRRLMQGASVLLPSREQRSACAWTRTRSRAPRRRLTHARRARSPSRRRSDNPGPVAHRREVVR
jgi:hypothetical protein